MKKVLTGYQNKVDKHLDSKDVNPNGNESGSEENWENTNISLENAEREVVDLKENGIRRSVQV